MGVFVVAAMAMIIATLLLLLRPWQQSTPAADALTARQINAGIYRDQLAELASDRTGQTLSDADYAQAKAELERRLLEDMAAGEPVPAASFQAPRTLLVLAVALPLLATGLYAWRGTPVAISAVKADATEAGNPGSHQVTPAQIEKMVSTLADKLEKDPNNPQGWAMLARSYRAMGRLQQANEAFAHVGPDLERDPLLLSEYADALATLAGGNLEGKPMELVAKALKLDPDAAMALNLAATAAYNRKDFPTAAGYWQHLLRLLPPDSDDARNIKQALAEVGAPVQEAPAPTAAAGGAGGAISGTVTLAPALAAKVQPSDTLFVFARPAGGGGMPLAVQRMHASDLPFQFKLDDSLAMSPQAKISMMSQVKLEARISRSGNAMPTSGDLIGVLEPVKVGATDVALRIDQVRP